MFWRTLQLFWVMRFVSFSAPIKNQHVCGFQERKPFLLEAKLKQPPKLGLMVCFRGYPRNCATLGRRVRHGFMARNRSDNICFQMCDQLLDI
jgi:hypothetical protein